MNLRFLQKIVHSTIKTLSRRHRWAILYYSSISSSSQGYSVLGVKKLILPSVVPLLFLTVFFSGTLLFYSIRLSQPVLSILGQSQIISFLFLQKQRIRALALKQQIYLYLIQTELILMGTYRILAQFIRNARVSKIYTFDSMLMNNHNNKVIFA